MSEQLLQQAAVAVKTGNRAQAIELIKQYIRLNPKEARGWWLLARLTENAEVKKESLRRVIRLQPDHQQASQMLAEIEAQEASLFSFNDDEAASPAWHSTGNPSALTTFDEHYHVDSGDSPASPFGDVGDAGEPAFGNFAERKARATPVFSRTNHRSSSQLEWALGIGIVLLVLLAIPAIAYYAYSYQHRGLFGLFGPDLDATAATNNFSLHYPNEWQGRIVEENTSVVAATQNIEAWQQLSSQNLISAESLISNNDLASQMDVAANQDTVVMVMAPVTPEMMEHVRSETGIHYNTFAEYINAIFTEAQVGAEAFDDVKEEGVEVNYHVGLSEKNVGGEPATYGSMSLQIKIDQDKLEDSGEDALALTFMMSFLQQLNIGIYMAAIPHNGTEYVFMVIALGENASNQQRTAERMLRSVEFLN